MKHTTSAEDRQPSRLADVPVFLLPSSFDPGKVLPRGLRTRYDDAQWFVAQLVRKAAYGETDDEGYAHLYSPILKRVMSKRSYAAVIDALISGGVLDPAKNHSSGRWSKGYRLAPSYLADKPKAVAATNPGIIRRIQREFHLLHSQGEARWLPIHFQLREVQAGLGILPAADEILEHLKPQSQLCQRVLIVDIRNGTPHFSLGNTGRCFNGITSLKRQLRQAVRLYDDPIAGVDIKCAQPALLAVLARLAGGRNVPTYIHTCWDSLVCLPSSCAPSRLASSGLLGLRVALSLRPSLIAPDFIAFEDLVLGGLFYEKLVALCRLRGFCLLTSAEEARSWVKKRFMRDVLAKRGDYLSDFEEVFRANFPSVHGFIRSVNCQNHGDLIRTLQRIESWLVIETIAPRLIGEIPILTLHDSIYGRSQDVGTVQDAFLGTFEDLGIRLQVKADSPAEESTAAIDQAGEPQPFLEATLKPSGWARLR